QREVIRPLTGLRFFAAISVALAHYAGAAKYTIFGLTLDTSALGMPVFFTLSGFVIHYVYAGTFARSWRTATGAFAAARCARLYPLFVLFFAFFSLFSDLGNLLLYPGIALSYLSLTGTWWYWVVEGKRLDQWSFGLSWSIATECFFYLC